MGGLEEEVEEEEEEEGEEQEEEESLVIPQLDGADTATGSSCDGSEYNTEDEA